MSVIRTTVFLALAGLIPSGALAAKIAPHRAIYELQLDARSEDSKFSAVEGRLAFEVDDAGCDGWTVSFRMANRYTPLEGNVRLVDTQSTSYETIDGTKYDYSEKTFVNQTLESETRLKVLRAAAGAAGSGAMTLPNPKDFEVDSGSVFPMQHQLRIMNMAEMAEARDTSLVFDGSEDEKPFRTITFIGKEKPAGSAKLDSANADLGPLRPLRAWPVTMSYYDTAGDNQDTPNYTVTFDLFENGVASGLRMDYGEFKMKGELSRLEMLEAEACN
jgi:hypothetical protein